MTARDDRIGPLLPAEWAELRLRDDDDLLSCCGVTSDFRDAVFHLLRMGDDVQVRGRVLPSMVTGFRRAYWDLVDHGLPEGRGGELVDRLARYYLGDPPAKANDVDRMHPTQAMVELCRRSGQPTVNVQPTRYTVCALPPEHQAYRYLALHVEWRHADRWMVRWGSYIFVFDADFENGDWVVPSSSSPDDVDADTWWRQREFPIGFAMRVAQDQATKVDVKGLTAADIIARDTARIGTGR